MPSSLNICGLACRNKIDHTVFFAETKKLVYIDLNGCFCHSTITLKIVPSPSKRQGNVLLKDPNDLQALLEKAVPVGGMPMSRTWITIFKTEQWIAY